MCLHLLRMIYVSIHFVNVFNVNVVPQYRRQNNSEILNVSGVDIFNLNILHKNSAISKDKRVKE